MIQMETKSVIPFLLLPQQLMLTMYIHRFRIIQTVRIILSAGTQVTSAIVISTGKSMGNCITTTEIFSMKSLFNQDISIKSHSLFRILDQCFLLPMMMITLILTTYGVSWLHQMELQWSQNNNCQTL